MSLFFARLAQARTNHDIARNPSLRQFGRIFDFDLSVALRRIRVVRLGKEAGVPTPVYEFIYAALLPQELKARGQIAWPE
ncbi:MAG: hypothetical protein HY680_03565 [Chloroflexi bacterium]|nr:hypothetical protein [Chloroflexota bacterium]